MTTSTLNRFFIYDGITAVDGEMPTTRAAVAHLASYYDKPDYVILGFDHSQLVTGSCQMVDVTAEIASEWWENGGEVETHDSIFGGEKVCWLARRFYDDQITEWENRLCVEETAADYWRDERVQAVA